MSDDSPPPARHTSVSYNARLGMALFILYMLLYGGFIYMNAFDRDLAGKDAIGGVNVAVVYGVVLIISAFVLAVIYIVLCRSSEPISRDSIDASTGGPR